MDMENKPKKGIITPYWQAIPDILRFQLAKLLIMALLFVGLRFLAMWVLRVSGHVAITSGDFSFLFNTWYGIPLFIIALAAVFLFVAFELNSTIIFSTYMLRGEKCRIWASMWEGFKKIYTLFTPSGIGVILYILLIAPLIGIGVSISIRAGLNVPNFIANDIAGSPLYLWTYRVFTVVFIVLGIFHIFVLHGVLLDKMKVHEALKTSRSMIKANWKNFLFESLRFIIVLALLMAIAVLVLSALPLYLMAISGEVVGVTRFFTLFFFLFGIALLAFFVVIAEPFVIMKITQLYDYYSDNVKLFYPRRERKKHRMIIIGVGAVVLGCLAIATIFNMNFDRVFPETIAVNVIAHRGGGNEGLENTLSGLRTAVSLGAYGSEIDVQRTLDGYYVINHDTTFKRVAGVNRKVSKMTLEEIRELRIKKRGSNLDEGEPVATLEEMLDVSKGHLILYIELKGTTADKKMADDVVEMVRERDMLDDCVLISLKYSVIDYIEKTWPEVHTAYLTYATFGSTAKLNCDDLGLEEETATALAIESIHMQDKQAMVWTPNKASNQKHFLLSRVDAMITDNVAQAFRIKDKLENRTDLQRIMDAFLGLLGVSIA